jgi:hypothetical protein
MNDTVLQTLHRIFNQGRMVRSAEEVLRQDRMAIQCPKCRRQSAWVA